VAYVKLVSASSGRFFVVGAVKVAACVDSTCSDGVQLADLVAGAVAHQRGSANLTASPSSHKGKIAARLAAAFDVVSFASDVRNGRVNVAILGQPAARRRTG
jgi:hypothetical protein